MLKAKDISIPVEYYNSLVMQSPYASVFQSYEWGELKKKQGWEPLRFVFENGEKQVGFTLLNRKIGGMPFFYSPRGPALPDIINNKENNDLLPAMLKDLRSLMQRNRVVFWKIDPEISEELAVQALSENGFKRSPDTGPFGGVQPRCVWRVPLKNGPISVKKSAQREIKKAQEENVLIKKCGREELPLFYNLLQETARRKGFYIRGFPYFASMWDCLTPAGFLELHMAFDSHNNPLCGALVAPFGKGVWDLYAATGKNAQKLGASYYLTWSLINGFAHRGYEFYDLGGVPANKQKNNGLYFFKSRFSGDRCDFIGEFDYVNLPLLYCFWNAANHLFRYVIKTRKKFNRVPSSE